MKLLTATTNNDATSWTLRYLRAATPALIALAGWQSARWAYAYFGCQGSLKYLEPCYIGSFDLVPWLEIGLFWCQMLSWIFGPISLVRILSLAIAHYQSSNSPKNS